MRIGEKLEKGKIDGAPPVVLVAQPTSYMKLDSPGALQEWEDNCRNLLGIEVSGSGLAGAASESCSGACSDDCDLA